MSEENRSADFGQFFHMDGIAKTWSNPILFFVKKENEHWNLKGYFFLGETVIISFIKIEFRQGQDTLRKVIHKQLFIAIQRHISSSQMSHRIPTPFYMRKGKRDKIIPQHTSVFVDQINRSSTKGSPMQSFDNIKEKVQKYERNTEEVERETRKMKKKN